MVRTDYIIKITAPSDLHAVKRICAIHQDTFLNAYVYLGEHYRAVITSFDPRVVDTISANNLDMESSDRYYFYWGTERIKYATYGLSEEDVLANVCTGTLPKIRRDIDIKTAVLDILKHRNISIPETLYADPFDPLDEQLFQCYVTQRLSYSIGPASPEIQWESLVQVSERGDDDDLRISKICAYVQAATNLNMAKK